MQELTVKVNKFERSYLLDIAIICQNDLVGDQRRELFRRWLSPPDPSINHNIARKAHHGGTATWFTRGHIMKVWKSTGSLLWIHGLRSYIPFVSFTIAYSIFNGQLDREKVCFGM